MGELKDLSILGIDFQYKLILQIISDEKFGKSIITLVQPDYFKDEYLKLIMSIIKDAYEEYDIIIDLVGIESRVMSKVKDEIKKGFLNKTLIRIKDSGLKDSEYIQKSALEFCKFKEIGKAVKQIESVVSKGQIERLEECETLIKNAISIGRVEEDEPIDAFKNDDIDELLAEDFRDPIPTGIDKLDEYMNGGLSKGEFAIAIAPTGVGKAQPLRSLVLTPDGYKTMGEINVGDLLIGSKGEEIVVEGVYPQEGLRDVVKLTMSDTTTVECDLEHLWSVYIGDNPEEVVLTTKDIMEIMKTEKVSIPLSPIHLQFRDNIKFHLPYMVGVMSGNMCNFIDDDLDFTKNVPQYGKIISEFRSELKVDHNDMSDDQIIDLIIKSVKTNDVMMSNLIPNEYLYSNILNRVKLLKGFVDACGIVKDGMLEVLVLGEEKKNQFIFLLKSLRCEINNIEDILGGNYLITFSLTHFTPEVEYLVGDNRNIGIFSKKLTSIISVDHVGKEETKCIKVSSKDSLYITDGLNLTHNTTLLTKIANTAKKNNKNVLQLFFEDSVKIIRRKHLACSSGIEINEMHKYKDQIKLVNDEMMETGGMLKLHKFKGNTTMKTIRNYIKKLRSKGFKPDMIILDYLDCVQPTTRTSDVNSDEGIIAREFENLLDEFDCAGWAATQSNRSGVSSDIVTADKVAGSFKKIQIGHFVLSLAKTLEQRETNRANMAILKSRIGPDGIVMNDIIFDNSKVEIIINDDDNDKSFYQNNKDKQAKKSEVVSEVMDMLEAKRKNKTT